MDGQRIHPECIDVFAQQQEDKSNRAQAKTASMELKKERATDKARKEALKRIPDLIKDAQVAFNAFIRARDADKGCFVCGEPFPDSQLGGAFDAGHVRSRGSAGHLRYNEDNCFGECKPCNASFGAKPHQIEAGAIRRIGVKRYEELRCDNTPKKWTREELIAIKLEYRAKLKELKRSDT